MCVYRSKTHQVPSKRYMCFCIQTNCVCVLDALNCYARVHVFNCILTKQFFSFYFFCSSLPLLFVDLFFFIICVYRFLSLVHLRSLCALISTPNNTVLGLRLKVNDCCLHIFFFFIHFKSMNGNHLYGENWAMIFFSTRNYSAYFMWKVRKFDVVFVSAATLVVVDSGFQYSSKLVSTTKPETFYSSQICR